MSVFNRLFFFHSPFLGDMLVEEERGSPMKLLYLELLIWIFQSAILEYPTSNDLSFLIPTSFGLSIFKS